MKRWFVWMCLLGLSQGWLAAQTVWHDPWEEASLPVQGRGWNTEIGKSYARLPLRAKDKVREPVWNLAQDCAGLYVKFYTNASEIQVQYQVSGALSMPHMPSTGVSGVDLYALDADGNQFGCVAQYSFGDTIRYRYQGLTYHNTHKLGNEFCLYLPLYNHVTWMKIGVPADARFEFVPLPKEKPIVVYGTSIAQGACASRPGMAWSNILQRRLDCPVINLGFSGNGQLDAGFVDLLSELDAAMFVIDCMPNMTGERKALIPERIRRTVETLRAKSQAPILLVDHDGYMGYKASDEKAKEFQEVNKVQQQVFQELKSRFAGLHYLSFEELGLSLESQVDGVHATDLGMTQYADAYSRKIRSILYPGADSLHLAPCRQHRDASSYDWNRRHEEVLAYNAEQQPQIVVLGNSIMHYWGGLPKERLRRADDVWQQQFAGKRVVNMGYGWDRLENMSWRILHGELDGFQAEKVFMMVGTNNIHLNTDEEIVEGTLDLVRLVKAKQPTARIYVIHIIPRRGYETRLVALNRLLDARLAGEERVKTVDVSAGFLLPSGKLDESLFSDGLHPTHAGYEVFSKALLSYIKE
ncbi:MAG: SGNH/GDSL hydrolase family protein [Parabacteroides sp.]